jgi:hypothetical protein
MVRGQSTRRIACVMAIAGAGSGCSVILDCNVNPDAVPDPGACAYKQPHDSQAAAQPLLVTDTGPAAICPAGDHDFYRFTVPADGSTVTMRITFDIVTHQDLDMNLYAAVDGTLLSSGVAFGAPEELIVCPGTAPNCNPLTAGDYILEVLGGGPALFNTYAIELTISP